MARRSAWKRRPRRADSDQLARLEGGTHRRQDARRTPRRGDLREAGPPVPRGRGSDGGEWTDPGRAKPHLLVLTPGPSGTDAVVVAAKALHHPALPQPDASVIAARTVQHCAATGHHLSVELADLGRREDALAASQEAADLYRELADRWPNAYRHELAQSLRVAAWLEHGQDLSDASPREPEA